MGLAANLLKLAATGEACPVGFNQNQAHAFGFLRGVGLAGQQQQICAVTIGGKDLLAIDHVLVSIANGLGANVLNIAAAGRLAHAQRHDHVASGHSR